MERFTQIAKALALGTVPVVGAFVCLLLLQISSAVGRASKDEARLAAGAAEALYSVNQPCTADGRQCGTIAQVDQLLLQGTNTAFAAHMAATSATRTIDSVNAAAQILNRPCGTDKPCGTLADIAKTLNTVRGTFGQVEIAANTFDKHQDALYAQETQLSTNAEQTLTSANAVTTHLDALLTSPDLTDTLHNVNRTSASVADGTQQMDYMLQDGKSEIDKLVAPKPKHWYDWLGIVGKDGGSLAWWIFELTH